MVDARDVAVVDDRAAPAGETPATVSFQMTWKGRGGRRRLAAASPAFAGQFFRHARAQGTFSGAEGGFAFASTMRGRARSTFAELDGAERELSRRRHRVPALRRASRMGARSLGSRPALRHPPRATDP